MTSCFPLSVFEASVQNLPDSTHLQVATGTRCVAVRDSLQCDRGPFL